MHVIYQFRAALLGCSNSQITCYSYWFIYHLVQFIIVGIFQFKEVHYQLIMARSFLGAVLYT